MNIDEIPAYIIQNKYICISIRKTRNKIEPTEKNKIEPTEKNKIEPNEKNKIEPNEKNKNTFILQKNWHIITRSREEPPSKYQRHRNAPNRPKKSNPRQFPMFFQVKQCKNTK